MYAEPWSTTLPLSSSGAPITAVFPKIATEKPKWSRACPSEAVNFASQTQTPLEFKTNMFALPRSDAFDPVPIESNSAPTIATFG